MSNLVDQEYVSIGGNRHSAASCWSRHSNLLAFGADQNVAVWEPLSTRATGIRQLLHGHKDKVTAVAFQQDSTQDNSELLLSGSADGQLLSWTYDTSCAAWRSHSEVAAHTGAINSIATLSASQYFVSGGADAKIKVWKVSGKDILEVLTIVPKPRLIPLTLVLGSFPNVNPDDAMFLAAAGTRNDIQVYALKSLSQNPTSERQATLTGHEGWIRSLSLKVINDQEMLLASASHDKYVRLWRFEHGDHGKSRPNHDSDQVTSFEQSLTAKVQSVSVGESRFCITFEALLLGHEDWVYTAAWKPGRKAEELLTASADGSLTIWEPDPASGIWVSVSKLGEISGQKGATTATGSSGGYWTGIWSPNGQSVTCLGRTGSWRIWHYDQKQQYWVQKHGVSGHVGAVNGLPWAPRGDYLLSTGSDQTTRLHAEWKRDSEKSWHEFARPQIHGYDLNCISSTGNHQFASGADEKLLRVFTEPKDIARMLKKLCDIEEPESGDLSETAAIPVLGLSNKAMDNDDDVAPVEANSGRYQEYITPDQDISAANTEGPPTEDLLARHTLWPEHEKLYGHGYEISESAYSSAYHVLATACKASSTDHAVIRLYDTRSWNEIKPPLIAHSLTVTRLAWSRSPDNYLLSVGRDRQWAVFKCDDGSQKWRLLQSNPKAHTRMILDAAWSPVSGQSFFATAGRDKTVKLWHCGSHDPSDGPKFEERSTIKRESAVTAIDFSCDREEKLAALAVGEESGALSIHIFSIDQQLGLVKSVEIDRVLCPSKSITRLAWRTNSSRHTSSDGGVHLAVAAADGSIRILAINYEHSSFS